MVVARRAKRKTWLTEPFLWKKKNFLVGLSVSVQFCMHCMPLQSFFMVCSNLRKIAILWPRFRLLLCNVTLLGWWKPSQKSLTLLNLPGYLLILPGRKQILIKRAIFSLGHGFYSCLHLLASILVVLLCGFTLDIKCLTALCTANHQITARNMSHAI